MWYRSLNSNDRAWNGPSFAPNDWNVTRMRQNRGRKGSGTLRLMEDGIAYVMGLSTPNPPRAIRVLTTDHRVCQSLRNYRNELINWAELVDSFGIAINLVFPLSVEEMTLQRAGSLTLAPSWSR
jgi:hypothetical protein